MGNADSQPELLRSNPGLSSEEAASSLEAGANSSPNRPSKTSASGNSSILLQVPSDALHCIASFLSPSEWRTISCTSRACKAACQNVYTRVRLHGFRCATEVASAWVSVLLCCCKFRTTDFWFHCSYLCNFFAILSIPFRRLDKKQMPRNLQHSI